MNLRSYVQLGPVLCAMACNSVLGIEPGSFLGASGAAGVSHGAAPATGGMGDTGSDTGGVHEAGSGTGGTHDAGSVTGGVPEAGSSGGGVPQAGPSTGGMRDAASGSGGAGFVPGSSAGGGGEAGSVDQARAGASPIAPGGQGGAADAGSGGDGTPFGGTFQGGGGNDAECAVGQTQCIDTTLKTCGKDGRWIKTDCDYACRPKQSRSGGYECGGSCSPGTTWCDSVTLLGFCDDSGTPHITSCADEYGNACVEKPVGSGSHGCSGTCIPDRLQCSDNTVQTCTERGNWQDQTACSGQTCIESSESASCEGECEPEQLQCDDQGAPQKCMGGQWVLAGSCSSSEASFQVCRDGICELADHFVGPSEPYEDSMRSYGDFLLVCRLPQLEYNAILLNFNVIGAPDAVEGVSARMVLYRDDGSGLAPTGDPVAQTEKQLFQLLPQQVTVDPSETEPRLEAGTVYWVGIVTDQETTVRGLSALSVSSGTGLCRTWIFDFQEPFGSAQTGILVENTDVNLFLEVRDID
ncbi:MAG: phage tail tape measure protein [Polyangiaceae bacterium]|nr:phage tail tape measure protein [Polyangiaceae bacterium]